MVLRVLGEVPAGRAPDDEVGPGTALRIMTGAMMPAGADTVVPVEDTDAPAGASEVPAAVAVRAPTRSGGNVRLPGSDVAAGTPLLERGRVLDPAAIALLAATGHAAVVVHRRPRVAVISTGDELVPPGQPLGPAQIHECNSFTLAAQAAEAGAEVRRMGIAARHPAGPARAPPRGGRLGRRRGPQRRRVSVGAHDHVKAAFSGIGQLDVWRVAIKPGRPFAFGRAAVDGRPAYLFGLPGNPVSVFVTFELFVRPVLRRLAGQGGSIGRPERIVRVAERIRGSSGRQTIARVVLEPDPDRPDGLLARPSGGQDSHMLFSLATANGLLFVPPDTDLEAGAEAVAWELRGGPRAARRIRARRRAAPPVPVLRAPGPSAGATRCTRVAGCSRPLSPRSTAGTGRGDRRRARSGPGRRGARPRR